MLPTQILCWTLTAWVSVQAITIPIDRADIKSAPTRSSMIANGWRPLTGYDGIGTNSGPSTNNHNERQTHPILGKYQEHMGSSEKSRIQYKANQQHEYSPPSILGSFSVFGHAATKARIKHKDHQIKQIIPSETREYTFLVPPTRDVFRFDAEPHRKGILRDNDAFLRQPSFISTGPQTDIRNAPFFIKPTGFSSTTHSPGFSKLRPFGGFGVQQTLQPPRHAAQSFEPQKVTSNNNKVFLQPPSAEVPASFNVKHKLSDNFETFQQTHKPQILNGDAGHFYSQVDHPAPYKTSYERDPAFLVHESHEVSYVTPSSTFGFNFRPSLPYDNISPSNNFDTSSTMSVASTTMPSSTLGKFLPSQAPNTIQAGIGAATMTSALGSTYYVSEHQDLTPPPSVWPIQKSKFTTEINEVLPKKNSPTKFRQEPFVTHPTPQQQRQQQHQQQQHQQQQHQHQQHQQQQHQQQQHQQHQHQQQQYQQQQHQHQQQHHHQQQRIPEIIFLRPDLQQQYQTASIPVTTVKQQTVEPQYETPESISLKHFNEQQYLIQQQLIQRDRQRLQEQEMQRQQKIQQQQEDELKKRQEELRILENQQKEIDFKKIEAERQEHAQEQLQNQKTLEDRKRFEEQHRLIAQQHEEQGQYELSQVVTEENLHHHDNEQINKPINYQHQEKQQQQSVQQPQQQQQLQKPESSDLNGGSEYTQTQGNYESEVITREPELKIRTHRPVKPQRGQYRRRRPTTPVYEMQATEASPQLETTFNSLSEVPVQTTIQPDSSTISVTARPRVRRPLNGGVRRRPRPTTTPLPEVDTTASANEDDYLKYDHAPQVDLAKKRRPIRPTEPAPAEEVVTERRPAIRKRPGHRVRVHPGEPFEAEVVTEIVKPTKTTYKETTEWENYPTSFEKSPASSAEESLTQVYAISTQEAEDLSTESVLPEHQTEVAFPEEHYVKQHASREHLEKLQNIPLEELFNKREENQVNLPTTAASYTTIATTLPISMTTTTPSTATTTTTESQVVTKNIISSTTRASHRIRPLRFGNATRPRFSVKDYRSRLDYKNRLGQLSTTEATPHSVVQTRQRSSTPKSQETSVSPRETTGRYKYMSRTSYRITSTEKPVRETSEYEQGISTTDRINRFTPKRRLNQNGHLYRSRIASSSSNGNGNKQDGQNENSIRYSTARPENVFSSAIRRRPGVLKNRIENTNEDIQSKKEDATEMTAEETSFYSIATTAPTLTESGNEVVSKDESATTSEKIIENVESVTKDEKSPLTSSENGMEVVELPHVIKMDNDNVMSDVEATRSDDTTSTESTFIIETTTAAVLQSEEELFAKASQSVADLTSSASALYDKPGLFKAVSPATESRVVNPNFKISTDEPTLPIEAFFQELSSKE